MFYGYNVQCMVHYGGPRMHLNAHGTNGGLGFKEWGPFINSSDEIYPQQLLGSSSSNCGSSSKLWPLGLDQNSLLENWILSKLKMQQLHTLLINHKLQLTTGFEGLGFKECNAQILHGEFFTPHCLKFDFGS